MDTLLRTILNKTFIIPISDEDLEVVQEIADAFMDDMDVDDLQLCGYVYFERLRIDEFQKAIESKAISNELYMPQLPNLAYIGLAEYILCYVAGDDVQADDFRFLTSLFIRNYLITQKYINKFHCPQPLLSALSYSSTYLRKSVVSDEVGEVLKPKIFAANDWKDIFDENTSLGQAHFEEIKQYAIKAEKYDFYQKVQAISSKAYSDKFQKALDVSYQLSHVSQWIMVDETPKATIKSIMGKPTKKRKLCDLRLDLSSCEIDDVRSNSSKLLQYLFSDNDEEAGIGQVQFSAVELSVYLYYEFLLEKLLIDYGE